MNRTKYAELLDTVSRQSKNIGKEIFIKKINYDAHRLAIDCLRLILTEAELLLKEETAKDLPDHGICKENNCDKKAEIDYNGHGHWVCRKHYESLSNYFDKEYQ